MAPRILFILKYREDQNGVTTFDPSRNKGLSSGLLNSARFIAEMLAAECIDAKLVQVADNNDIDREVHQYRPTHVVIEALWVVPEKFDVLQRLHPSVKWVVRGHSELPFLANEGIAMDWLTRYVRYENVFIATNSPHSHHDIQQIIRAANPGWGRAKVGEKVLHLPNWYPHHKRALRRKQEDGFLDVACFGAIRPLKNHLVQAAAAIEYAGLLGKKLRFHVNATRCEQGGNSVLSNLEALFATTGHELVRHPWMEHHEFLRLLQTMDMGMQVSFSETFNIVTADCVSAGLPVVVSPEVMWASSWCQAEPTNSEDILLKMIKVNDWRMKLALKVLNQRGLKHYCERSRKIWLEYLQN